MSEASNADPRYWKISPGQGAKYWDEWRQSGFIAIGWNDLGDVLGLTEPEFQERRDELIAQHDDWTEAKLIQVWDFAHINEGDRVVANQGIGKVLGIGTVIGAYEFVPSAELGHRLPVQWDDLTPRQIHEGNWRNTLKEFKAYVSGHGRKAIWKQLPWISKWIVPHYYVDREDASRVSGHGNLRAGYCDVTGQTNERTVLTALIPEESVAGNKVPTLRVDNFGGNEAQIHLLWLAVANSFVVDWLMRVRMSTTINFFHWYQIPFPRLSPASPQAVELIEAATRLSMVGPQGHIFSEEASYPLDALGLPGPPNNKDMEEWERQYIRAAIDARVAALYGLSTLEYAFILSTFPLLDRQQPSLPKDLGLDGKPRSYITRDLALLTYCRHMDAEPPTDVVAAYGEVGIDIEYLTGPIHNLEERVERGLAAGATAYVPTGTKNGRA